MPRVLVVDDQELYRRAMVEVVEATETFVLVGEADSGEAALEKAADLSPDLAVVDKRMPGIDGYETTRRLRRNHPGIVVLIASVEEPHPERALAAGAAAAVHKRDLSPALLREAWADERA